MRLVLTPYAHSFVKIKICVSKAKLNNQNIQHHLILLMLYKHEKKDLNDYLELL